MLKDYIKSIHEIYNSGDAREETYYFTLKKLLEQYAASVDKKGFQVTTLPKKTGWRNPDFRVWSGTQKVVGYIEAKSPDVTDLLIEGIPITRETQEAISVCQDMML